MPRRRPRDSDTIGRPARDDRRRHSALGRGPRGPHAARRAATPARRCRTATRFDDALRSSPAPRVIAECKRRSPSKGILRKDYDAASHAAAYAAASAAAISVLTEPTFFDGSLDHLAQVRAAVTVPLLRKDFIVHEYQLVEAVANGADAVLLIVGALDDRGRSARSQQGDCAWACDARRSPRSGGARPSPRRRRRHRRRQQPQSAHVDRRSERARRAGAVDPGDVTAVAESGIRTTADIERLSAAGYSAFLVGERLIVEPDPGAPSVAETLRETGADRGQTPPGTSMTRVKICGIRRVEDAFLATELGATRSGSSSGHGARASSIHIARDDRRGLAALRDDRRRVRRSAAGIRPERGTAARPWRHSAARERRRRRHVPAARRASSSPCRRRWLTRLPA